MYWNFTDITVDMADPTVPRFGSRGERLAAEIGFGNGEFLERAARSRPDTIVVGFEISRVYVAKAARRLIASGIKNARLVLGDARHLLTRTFAPGSLSEIWMNFPCPWPKRKHAEHRVGGRSFVEALSRVMAPGAAFELATDVDWYAAETAASFEASECFDAGEVVRDPDREIDTKYERKWRAMGRSVYTARAVRNGSPIPPAEVEEMTDEVSAPEGAKFDQMLDRMRSLCGQELSGPGWHAVFGEIFVSADRAALMRTITSDEGFEQRFFIKLLDTAHGPIVKTESTGRPFNTIGVRAALRHAADASGASL